MRCYEIVGPKFADAAVVSDRVCRVLAPDKATLLQAIDGTFAEYRGEVADTFDFKLPDDEEKLRAVLMGRVDDRLIVVILDRCISEHAVSCWSDKHGWVALAHADRFAPDDLGTPESAGAIWRDGMGAETGRAVSERLARILCDSTLSADDLDVHYRSNGGEQPDYVRADWRYEVANEDTTVGYWDWVAHKLSIEYEDFMEQIDDVGVAPAPG